MRVVQKKPLICVLKQQTLLTKGEKSLFYMSFFHLLSETQCVIVIVAFRCWACCYLKQLKALFGLERLIIMPLKPLHKHSRFNFTLQNCSLQNSWNSLDLSVISIQQRTELVWIGRYNENIGIFGKSTNQRRQGLFLMDANFCSEQKKEVFFNVDRI